MSFLVFDLVFEEHHEAPFHYEAQQPKKTLFYEIE